jgi:hypothetical protein
MSDQPFVWPALEERATPGDSELLKRLYRLFNARAMDGMLVDRI